MASGAQRQSSKKKIAVSDGPLTPKPYPEIVIGLVGPAGVDINPIVDAFQRELEAVGCCRFRGHRPKLLELSQSLSD